MLPRMVATASLDGREVDARAEREWRCAGWRAGRDFFPAWPPRPASRQSPAIFHKSRTSGEIGGDA